MSASTRILLPRVRPACWLGNITNPRISFSILEGYAREVAHPPGHAPILPSNCFRNPVRYTRSSRGDCMAGSSTLVDDLDVENVLRFGQFCVSAPLLVPPFLLFIPSLVRGGLAQ